MKVELPAKGRLIHLRLTPARGGGGPEIQSIALRGRTGEALVWRFDSKP